MRILPTGRRIGDAGRPSLASRDLEWEANSYGFKRRSNSSLMGGRDAPPVFKSRNDLKRHASGLRKVGTGPFENVTRLLALVGAHFLFPRVRTRRARRSPPNASVTARMRMGNMSFADDPDELFYRVTFGRRFAPFARFRQDAVSVIGNGPCGLTSRAQPIEHAKASRPR
jgi:hypothetical protein